MNVKVKRLLGWMLAFVMVMGLVPANAFAASGAGRFADIPANAWYSEAVAYVADNGLMVGVGDRRFAPDDLTTRGMVVTVLHRMEGSPVAQGAGFADVADGAWYTKAVLWAQAQGIVEGYGDGLFRPDKTMTREEMMTVIYRYSRYKGCDVAAADVLRTVEDRTAIQNYAENAMNWAVSVGLIKGFPDGTLRPQASSERAQLAAVLMRLCNYIGADNLTMYTRAGWIKLLVDTCDYAPCNVDTDYYSDIAESEYVAQINTAVAYGILPANGGAFQPDSIATREFAAAAAVRSMGYIIPEAALSCDDAAQIDEPAVASLAIELGLLELEDNKYYPDRPLTLREASRIMEVIRETCESTRLAGDGGRGYGYLDTVTVLKDAVVSDVDGDTVSISLTPELADLQNGDIVVIDEQKAYKVVSAEYTDSAVKIDYTSPELYEFLDYIDIQGEGYLDFSGFIPAEGVTVTGNGANQARTARGIDNVLDVPESEIDLGVDLKLTGEVDLGHDWTLAYEMGVAVPKVTYKVDVDFNPLAGFLPGVRFVDIRNIFFKLEESVGVKVNVGAIASDFDLLDNSLFKSITLGYVPLIGTNGFGALVEVRLVMNAQGTFELQINQAGALGAQILDNRPRNISNFDVSASFGVTGEIKVGPQVYVVAEVFEKDLVSFGLDFGLRICGTAALRSTGMLCMDGRVNAYAELKAFDKCLVDDWLDIALVWEIWNEQNSFLKFGFHHENLVWVPQCTYSESALIRGAVANAEDRSQYIANAKIEIRDAVTLEVVETVYTDADGRYSAVVPGGTYLIDISAANYIPFRSHCTVAEKQEVFIETFLMVAGEEDANETGTIGGKITNVVTGMPVAGVTLTIRKGWNQTTGEIVAVVMSNQDGNYKLNLPLGNYTILMEKADYVTDHFNVAVAKTENLSWHGTLNPNGESAIPTGDMRIVLTWGLNPRDLDSHLCGPRSDWNGRFHVYFSAMKYASEGTVHAFLDLDDTNSYGPETTTIYSMNQQGTYSFYVHDYTNAGKRENTQLANSGAKVTVYVGDDIVATYHVPVDGVGDLWHVFDFDADSRLLTPVNQFTTVGYASAVGSANGRSVGVVEVPEK